MFFIFRNIMDNLSISAVAKSLVMDGKGILAADESAGTIAKRLETVQIENTEANRQAYRELLFTAPDMEKYISGVIMFDETIRQTTRAGVSFIKLLNDKGVVPGIKVDQGVKDMDGSSVEKITVGLDGLDARLKEYYSLGARFAKWRAIFTVGDGLPTEKCIKLNAQALAKYTQLCQKNNLVPIVEPEVLMDGSHTIKQCYEATVKVLAAIFVELKAEKIDFSGMLLKPNMVIYSLEGEKAEAGQVAENTLKCLNSAVPAEVPGIVFLSGGQSGKEAFENLNAINKAAHDAPWKLSFSYGRALQNTALKIWAGKEENILAAQQEFISCAKSASSASKGQLK